MKIVKFKYCDEFHCIGPDCTDHCCKDWRILFGKREYLNYKKANCSKKLKDRINNSFERVRDNKKTGLKYGENTSYVKIKLNEKGECPLRDTDGLCMVQKELGESFLSHTCDVFPRLYGTVGGETLIFGCNITCSHVMELLTAHPEGLEVVEEEYDGSVGSVNKGLYSIEPTAKEWEGYPWYWTIKSAQIDILQNRNFTIPERLLILGFFSKKTDEYINAGQGEKIESLYNMILDNEFCRSIADSLKAPQSDVGAAAKSVNGFLKMYQKILNTDKFDHISELFDQTAKSISVNITKIEGSDNKVKVRYNIDEYFKNLEIFHNIEADKGYVFENAFVNLAFVTPPHKGIFKSFFELAMFYNVLKISIPALLKENWSDQDLALAITYSAKMVINTQLVGQVSATYFLEHDSFDLPHIAFMIS